MVCLEAKKSMSEARVEGRGCMGGHVRLNWCANASVYLRFYEPEIVSVPAHVKLLNSALPNSIYSWHSYSKYNVQKSQNKLKYYMYTLYSTYKNIQKCDNVCAHNSRTTLGSIINNDSPITQQVDCQ